ncbi:MAG: hypothetical protein M3214_03040 [Actinomycetota bacterium]|nr:hypothetical protein [Actinomycetota bacterium]
MRIIIETDETTKPAAVTQKEEPARAAGTDLEPPDELAARAAAMGAFSAGPAPPDLGAGGAPAGFVEEPTAPETTPHTGDAAMSAGSAPDFAAGLLDVVTVEAEGEAASDGRASGSDEES